MLTQTNIDALNAILTRIQRGEHQKDIAKLIGCSTASLCGLFTTLRKIGVDVPKNTGGGVASVMRELAELRRYKAERERLESLTGYKPARGNGTQLSA